MIGELHTEERRRADCARKEGRIIPPSQIEGRYSHSQMMREFDLHRPPFGLSCRYRVAATFRKRNCYV